MSVEVLFPVTGLILVDKDYVITHWNQYLENTTGELADSMVGRTLWDVFPLLPEMWFRFKCHQADILGFPVFSVHEGRPHLFPIRTIRSATGGSELMIQDVQITALPGHAGYQIVIIDQTDSAIAKRALNAHIEVLQETSNTDPLTGIYNRRFLDQQMLAESERLKRKGGRISMVLIDIDHFKRINDNYGHEIGDVVLRETCERVSGLLRKPDIFCRFGGEEFALLLPSTDGEGALIAAERLRLQVCSQPFLTTAGPLSVTASFGVAEASAMTISSLFKMADEALYSAKNSGRNRVAQYGSHIQSST